MYQCLNSSTCILNIQICDGANDCVYKDDEQCPLINETCTILDSDILFKCKSTNQCISRKLLVNGACDCIYLRMMMRRICNGIIDMSNILIDNQNETDETESNDGQIDCLGATDEPKLCQQDNEPLTTEYFYYYQCLHRDKEPLCNQTRNITKSDNICYPKYDNKRSSIDEFFCGRFHYFGGTREFFYLPDDNRIIKQETKMVDNEIEYDQQRCHRGLPLRVWLDNKKTVFNETCLSPPSYYGNECQYQNQRISLTVQFRTYSNSRRTLFTILISLIDIDDEQRIVYSYQQHTYLYLYHCSIKYNINLLYPTRPKHPEKNYSIQIDFLHLLRRIKYYQKPCQDYFCLCYNFTYQRRLANCFQFNSSLQHNCYGLSVCENDAQCIQDTSKCPKVSMCVCPKCYHGTRCQFNSHLFGLSLDAIH
ncbi:hypothetical protein I4U23_022800, partial [Adineta vaga]